MSKPFRDALLELVEATPGLSLRKVALGSGVSYEQLKKMNQREGQSIDVEDARKIASWLGLTVEEMTGDTSLSDRAQIVSQWTQLSPRERAILRAARSDLPGFDQEG